MPLISRIMVRTALLHLALGATIGALMLIEKGLNLTPWIWTWRPGHIQMLLFGWMIQLALGVATWILPRLDARNNRGNLIPMWLCYIALNSGISIAALHAPLATIQGREALVWMLPTASMLYILAIASALSHLWRRVLPFRTLPKISSDS